MFKTTLGIFIALLLTNWLNKQSLGFVDIIILFILSPICALIFRWIFLFFKDKIITINQKENDWTKIKDLLSTRGYLAKSKLNTGATKSDFDALEKHIGVTLPIKLKEFLSIHNGQDDEGAGIIFGVQILSTTGIKRHWDSWREIDEEDMNEDSADFMESDPKGYIKPMYTNRKWIPLTYDGGGNHIGIDYDPDERGNFGQIITFGSDEDTKHLIAPNFSEYIAKLSISLKSEKLTDQFLYG